jgi:hypothetical protein
LEVEKMLLMGTATFPVASAADFGRAALDELKNNPYPEFTKRSYYCKFSEAGMTMYVIWDIEEGNEGAALKDINARIYKMSSSVKGFTGSIEPVFGVEEAFSLISMAAPSA